jgi:hypothetical protein
VSVARTGYITTQREHSEMSASCATGRAYRGRRQEAVLRTRLDRPTAERFDRLAEEAGLNRSELLRRVIVETVRRERQAA